MAEVKVNALKIVDESFPTFLEFELIDCIGEHHYFIDKLPIISSDYDTVPPFIGTMRCKIIEIKENTIVIDTSLPDDIESTNGEYQFELYKNQVIM